MVTHTPARLFMMTGDAGTGKTTDARMIAQILGLPYYVFTCGPGTDELELLATTVPNMGGTAHLEMELPRLEDIEMDPASALATVNGSIGEALGQLYVDEMFPPEAKEKAELMIANIISAFQARIKKLDWMGDSTKLKAIEKLEGRDKVGIAGEAMSTVAGAAAGTGTEQMSINNAISIPVTFFVVLFVVSFAFFIIHTFLSFLWPFLRR